MAERRNGDESQDPLIPAELSALGDWHNDPSERIHIERNGAQYTIYFDEKILATANDIECLREVVGSLRRQIADEESPPDETVLRFRELPFDLEGRVRVWGIADGKVLERWPIDAMEGIRNGSFRFATNDEIAAHGPPPIRTREVSPNAKETTTLAIHFEAPAVTDLNSLIEFLHWAIERCDDVSTTESGAASLVQYARRHARTFDLMDAWSETATKNFGYVPIGEALEHLKVIRRAAVAKVAAVTAAATTTADQPITDRFVSKVANRAKIFEGEPRELGKRFERALGLTGIERIREIRHTMATAGGPLLMPKSWRNLRGDSRAIKALGHTDCTDLGPIATGLTGDQVSKFLCDWQAAHEASEIKLKIHSTLRDFELRHHFLEALIAERADEMPPAPSWILKLHDGSTIKLASDTCLGSFESTEDFLIGVARAGINFLHEWQRHLDEHRDPIHRIAILRRERDRLKALAPDPKFDGERREIIESLDQQIEHLEWMIREPELEAEEEKKRQNSISIGVSRFQRELKLDPFTAIGKLRTEIVNFRAFVAPAFARNPATTTFDDDIARFRNFVHLAQIAVEGSPPLPAVIGRGLDDLVALEEWCDAAVRVFRRPQAGEDAQRESRTDAPASPTPGEAAKSPSTPGSNNEVGGRPIDPVPTTGDSPSRPHDVESLLTPEKVAEEQIYEAILANLSNEPVLPFATIFQAIEIYAKNSGRPVSDAYVRGALSKRDVKSISFGNWPVQQFVRAYAAMASTSSAAKLRMKK